MPEVVYVLCALTSLACAVLLLRSYLRTRTRMLLWSSLCFVGLAANNLLLFVDLALVSSGDLSLLRTLVALASVLLLLVGLVGDAG
jgi:hypothetical protein